MSLDKAPISLRVERQKDGLCIIGISEKGRDKVAKRIGVEAGIIPGNFSLEFAGHGVDQDAAAVKVNALQLQVHEGVVYFLGGLQGEEQVALPFHDVETDPNMEAMQKTNPDIPKIKEGLEKDEEELPSWKTDPPVRFLVPPPMVEYNADRFVVPKGKIIPQKKLSSQQRKDIQREMAIRIGTSIAVFENNASADNLVHKFTQEAVERGEMENPKGIVPLENLYVLNAYPQEPLLQRIFEEMVKNANDPDNLIQKKMKALLEDLHGSVLERALAFLWLKKMPASKWAAEQLKILKKKK